jgi:hypothetical protein
MSRVVSPTSSHRHGPLWVTDVWRNLARDVDRHRRREEPYTFAVARVPAGARADVKLLLSPTRANFELGIGRAPVNSLISQQDSNGYRIARVNSHRESRPSERLFAPRSDTRVNNYRPRNGGIPGLQRPDPRAERVSAEGVLAEGELPASKHSLVVFQ